MGFLGFVHGSGAPDGVFRPAQLRRMQVDRRQRPFLPLSEERSESVRTWAFHPPLALEAGRSRDSESTVID